jgi:ABC-type multidrug transport system permease subunit
MRGRLPRLGIMYAILTRDLQKFLKDIKTNFLRIFIQPLIYLIVFGVILARTSLISSEFVVIAFSGLILMTAVSAGLFGAGIPLTVAKNLTGSLEEEMLVPISYSELAIAKVLYSFIESFLSTLSVTFLGILFLQQIVPFSINLPLIIVVLVTPCITFSSIGVALGSSFGNPRKVVDVGNIVGFLFSYFGCTFYTFDVISQVFEPLAKVSLVFPTTYFSELTRYAILEYSSSLSCIFLTTMVCIITILSMLGGLYIFKRNLQQ